MKGMLNFLFILTSICSIFLFVIDMSNKSGVLLMIVSLMLSIVGTIFNSLFNNTVNDNTNVSDTNNIYNNTNINPNINTNNYNYNSIINTETTQKKSILNKIISIISYIMLVLSIVTISIHSMTIDNFSEKVKSIFVGNKIYTNTIIDVYEIKDDFKITFDYVTNNLVVYKSDVSSKVTGYMLSLFEIKDETSQVKSEDIKNGYHGKLEFNGEKNIILYGIFEYLDEGTSKAIPYIEIDGKMYSIKGNSLIINDVFTKLFNNENIFKKNVLSIQALILNNETNQKENTVVEEYYMDDQYRYLYNGERVYKDLYICEDYSILTYTKMSKYINDMNLQKQKDPSKLIGKEIKVNNEHFSKVRLYYYNNLESINFIELIFKDKKESIIFKESNAKFKYDDILKLY